MNVRDEMKKLITAAGLEHQHRCDGCGAMLEAFGRYPQESSGPGGRKETWSCAECKLPGATTAERYKEPIS